MDSIERSDGKTFFLRLASGPTFDSNLKRAWARFRYVLPTMGIVDGFVEVTVGAETFDECLRKLNWAADQLAAILSGGRVPAEKYSSGDGELLPEVQGEAS